MRETRHNTLRIQTPEGVVFSLLLAGPVSRSMAWLVDAVISIAVTIGIYNLSRFVALIHPDAASSLFFLAYFAVDIGYFILLESLWRGQTLGKRWLGLRVVDAEGLRLELRQIVIRNLLRFVDRLPLIYLLGGVISLLSARSQRLGDIAAGTVVVRRSRVPEPDVEQLVAGKFNSLRHHPHLGARLRQRTSPEEASLALRALIRREAFDPAERARLFAEIAAHFRSVVEFPQETWDGITAEQYVRNVVDVLYSARRTVSAATGAPERGISSPA